MKERQIPFSGAMVRALLDGRKTQTRRIFSPERMTWTDNGRYQTHALRSGELVFTGSGPFVPSDWLSYSPYGQPGDRLWVREAWRVSKKHDAVAPRDLWACMMTVMYEAGAYSNNDDEGGRTVDGELMAPDWRGKYRPSMFMPRWASRITLEVTGVRVERLQDISDADAIAEGAYLFPAEGGGYKFDCGEQEYDTAVEAYRHLWDSLNAARGFGWDANPWVWVVDFQKVGQ